MSAFINDTTTLPNSEVVYYCHSGCGEFNASEAIQHSKNGHTLSLTEETKKRIDDKLKEVKA